LFCLAFAGISSVFWFDVRRARRADYILHFTLPPSLFDKLRQHHPHLTQKDCQLAAQGRQQRRRLDRQRQRWP
jgi:hypothetical protein